MKESKFIKTTWPEQHAINQKVWLCEPFLLLFSSPLAHVMHSSYSADKFLKFICKNSGSVSLYI